MLDFNCILQPLRTQELKAFRATLTTEQWQRWLNFARTEKQKMRSKKATSPKALILTRDPEQLLQAIMKTEKTLKSSDAPVQDESPRDIPQPSTEHIPVAEASWAQSILTAVSPQNGQKVTVETKAPPLQENSKQLHSISAAPSALPPQAIHEELEERRELSKWVNPAQLEQGVVDHQPSMRKSQQGSSLLSTSEKHSSRTGHAAIDKLDHSYEKSSNSGVSLELGMIRRTSRGRAASAPRERHFSTPTTISMDHQHASFNMEMKYRPVSSFSGNGYQHAAIPPDRNQYYTHSPKLKHSRQEDFFGGALSSPSRSPPAVQQWQKQYLHQQHQYSQKESLGSHVSNGTHVSRVRDPHSPDTGFSQYAYDPARPAGPFSSRASHLHPAHSQLQSRYSQREHEGSPQLDLADAAEIARSTAFRLDSAYSAAQCLLSTISADQAQGFLTTGGRNLIQTPVVSSDRIEQEK